MSFPTNDDSRPSHRPALFSTLILGLFGSLGLGCSFDAGPDPSELVVFAAASLTEVVSEAGSRFLELENRGSDRPSLDLVYNLAGSNFLAQQIQATPCADVFLSAHPEWVQDLVDSGRIEASTRTVLFSNRLVLVAHPDAATSIRALKDLAEDDFRHLSLANPEAVPAGTYAKAALEAVRIDGTTLWSIVRDRVAPALDVRAALALVESDPRVLGIVYKTDAATSEKVRILCEIPTGLHPPIEYVGGIVSERANEGLSRRFFQFLQSDDGREILHRHGFSDSP